MDKQTRSGEVANGNAMGVWETVGVMLRQYWDWVWGVGLYYIYIEEFLWILLPVPFQTWDRMLLSRPMVHACGECLHLGLQKMSNSSHDLVAMATVSIVQMSENYAYEWAYLT